LLDAGARVGVAHHSILSIVISCTGRDARIVRLDFVLADKLPH
jgi:hypothetical protein